MIWRGKTFAIDLSARAAVMGILNVTLDSFSDAGKYLDPERALEHARLMIAEGADIIDVGGESTRPGAEPVPEDVELARVLPVVKALAREKRALISIDTSKAAVAEAVVAHGAAIINDVTGLRGDPRMTKVARETGAGVVIMHMQGTPRTMQAAPHYDDVVAEVRNFFRQSLDLSVACGIDPMSIAFDPGIGFGKTVAHNLALLKNLAALRCDDRPLLIGVSRKSFIGKVLGTESMEDRFWPTVALTSLLREKGAAIFRVHDVRPNVEALRMTEAILAAGKAGA